MPVSQGVQDFLLVLLILADDTRHDWEDVRMMWGRCPDCWETLSGRNPNELAGDVLGHAAVCEAFADSE